MKEGDDVLFRWRDKNGTYDANNVTILSPMSGDKFIEVFDINGRKVISTIIFDDDLDVSNLVSGFYTTRVTIAGKTSVAKLIVK